jgi:phosphopantothenate-cysteine ligase
VIGNDLHRRKYEVVFVEPDPGPSDRVPSSSSQVGETSRSRISGESGVDAEPGGFKETWLRLEDIRPSSLVNGTNGSLEEEGDSGSQVEVEIESLIIEELVKRHTKWIEGGKR